MPPTERRRAAFAPLLTHELLLVLSILLFLRADKLPISFLPPVEAEFGATSWVGGTALPLCMRAGQALGQVLLSSTGSAGGVGTASAPAQPSDAESRPHCFRNHQQHPGRKGHCLAEFRPLLS